MRKVFTQATYLNPFSWVVLALPELGYQLDRTTSSALHRFNPICVYISVLHLLKRDHLVRNFVILQVKLESVKGREKLSKVVMLVSDYLHLCPA